MQFSVDNDYYKIARITGIHHNFLSIKFSIHPCEPDIIELSGIENSTSLKKSLIFEYVMKGLDEIKNKKGKNYYIAEIQFIASDTRPYSIYRYLIQELVKRKEDMEKFDVKPQFWNQE